MPPWCESILCLKVEAVQGKQVFLDWNETSGGLSLLSMEILQARMMWVVMPPSGDLPNPGIEPVSPVVPALLADFFTTELLGNPPDRHFMEVQNRYTVDE